MNLITLALFAFCLIVGMHAQNCNINRGCNVADVADAIQRIQTATNNMKSKEMRKGGGSGDFADVNQELERQFHKISPCLKLVPEVILLDEEDPHNPEPSTFTRNMTMGSGLIGTVSQRASKLTPKDVSSSIHLLLNGRMIHVAIMNSENVARSMLFKQKSMKLQPLIRSIWMHVVDQMLMICLHIFNTGLRPSDRERKSVNLLLIMDSRRLIDCLKELENVSDSFLKSNHAILMMIVMVIQSAETGCVQSQARVTRMLFPRASQSACSNWFLQR